MLMGVSLEPMNEKLPHITKSKWKMTELHSVLDTYAMLIKHFPQEFKITIFTSQVLHHDVY